MSRCRRLAALAAALLVLAALSPDRAQAVVSIRPVPAARLLRSPSRRAGSPPVGQVRADGFEPPLIAVGDERRAFLLPGGFNEAGDARAYPVRWTRAGHAAMAGESMLLERGVFLGLRRDVARGDAGSAHEKLVRLAESFDGLSRGDRSWVEPQRRASERGFPKERQDFGAWAIADPLRFRAGLSDPLAGEHAERARRTIEAFAERRPGTPPSPFRRVLEPPRLRASLDRAAARLEELSRRRRLSLDEFLDAGRLHAFAMRLKTANRSTRDDYPAELGWSGDFDGIARAYRMSLRPRQLRALFPGAAPAEVPVFLPTSQALLSPRRLVRAYAALLFPLGAPDVASYPDERKSDSFGFFAHDLFHAAAYLETARERIPDLSALGRSIPWNMRLLDRVDRQLPAAVRDEAYELLFDMVQTAAGDAFERGRLRALALEPGHWRWNLSTRRAGSALRRLVLSNG